MPRPTKPRRRPARPPGTVEYVGERKVERMGIHLMDYDSGRLTERDVAVADLASLPASPTTSWIDVIGLHETDALQQIGNQFGIHPLVLEDIVQTHQRPKAEDHGEYLYIVVRALQFAPGSSEFLGEQISLLLGPRYLISFQERPGALFDPIRERIRAGKGRIRGQGPDYLAYALLDAVIDHYFVILERAGEQIEALEDALMREPRSELLHAIHRLRGGMIQIRRSVWPLRELITGLLRDGSSLVSPATAPFLRDLYDHTIQIADTVEAYRDILAGLQELYLSSLNNRISSVMKVLTVIATVFIPLTFLTGVFGMNFAHMPELHWKWGYPLFWLTSLAITGIMLAIFRRKGWL